MFGGEDDEEEEDLFGHVRHNLIPPLFGDPMFMRPPWNYNE